MRWPDAGGKLRSTKLCWSKTELCCHTENRSSILRRNWPAKCFRSESDTARALLKAVLAHCEKRFSQVKSPCRCGAGWGSIPPEAATRATSYLLPGLGGKFLNSLFTALFRFLMFLSELSEMLLVAEPRHSNVCPLASAMSTISVPSRVV